MSRARVFLTIILFLFFSSTNSQNAPKGVVSGKIVFTDAKLANDQSTILLLRAKDSVVYRSTFPDKSGLFEISQVIFGKYLLLVRNVGVEKYYSPKFDISAEKPLMHFDVIQLVPLTNQLKSVEVESTKPFVERKLDRFIINVDNSITAAGSTVLNVLERSPGVIVNEENGIKLRGKQGVIIMIDGKPSPLAGADLMTYLKGLPANTIDKIEIITNPSSRYDAAGNAGIINIKFKKDARQGFNGTLTLADGQGVYNKPSSSINLNYRKKKWNVFGNYSFSKPINFTRFYINRRFFDNAGSTLSIFDQTSFIKQPLVSQNFRLGADYYLGKKTVIGVLLSGSFLNNNRNGNTNSIVADAIGNTQYTTKTTNILKGYNQNLFGNFNFKHTFDTTGKELTVDADLGYYESNNDQNFSNQYYNAANNPTSLDVLKTIQFGSIDVKSIKADYINPLSKTSKWEAGFKISDVKTDADIQFYTGSANTFDPQRSNHFLYRENVNALYSNFSKQFVKTDIQVGLRIENTVTNGHQITTGERFSRNYTMLFPSFFINQKLNDKNQLSFSYSRRIDRPSYRQLNPFKIFVDPYTYVVGDPALFPVSTHSLEINHTFKNKYITTLSWAKSKSTITDVFAQDDVTKISYQIPANIQDFEQYNLGITIPWAIKKWMNANVSASVYRNIYSGPLQGGQMTNDFTAWDVNITSSYIIGKKGWAAELSGFYQSKNAWGLFIIKNLAQVSTGIQKTTANKKSTFKLAITDIFLTNRIAVIVDYQNMDFNTNRTWDSRVATLSFTHRFGSNKVAQARRRSSGVEEEKKRAN